MAQQVTMATGSFPAPKIPHELDEYNKHKDRIIAEIFDKKKYEIGGIKFKIIGEGEKGHCSRNFIATMFGDECDCKVFMKVHQLKYSASLKSSCGLGPTRIGGEGLASILAPDSEFNLPIKLIIVDLEDDSTEIVDVIPTKLNASQFIVSSIFPYVEDCMDLFNYFDEKLVNEERDKRLFTVVNIIKQCFKAIAKLHAQGVMHRDLKLENFLINLKTLKVQLIDWGNIKEYRKEARRQSYVGTPGSIAPEIIHEKSYDKSVDWYSFGTLIFNLLFNCFPFQKRKIEMNDEGEYKIVVEPVSRSINNNMKEYYESAHKDEPIFPGWWDFQLEEAREPELKKILKGEVEFLKKYPNLIKLLNGLITLHPKDRLTEKEIKKYLQVMNSEMEFDIEEIRVDSEEEEEVCSGAGSSS